MKKIVSAVALASLVAGAFAADVTIKSQIKYQPTVAEFDSAKDYKVNTFAKQPDTKDTFQINIKQDNVRVQGKFDATSSAVKVNTAYGDVKIGNATITAGILESRFTNRVTNDQNDLSLIEQNYAAKRWAGKKAGTSNWSTTAIAGVKKLGINPNIGLASWSKAGVDADCVTDLQGSKVSSLVFDYTIADVLPGKILLKAVAKANSKAWYSEDKSNVNGTDTVTSTTQNDSGYSFEAAWTHESFTLDTVMNLDRDNIGSFGVYASPLVVDGLTATFGFTYAWDKSWYSNTAAAKKSSDGFTLLEKKPWAITEAETSAAAVTKTYHHDDTFWAIDARARYAVNDALAFGIYSNLTSYKLSWLNDSDIMVGTNTYGAQMALDVVLNVNYKLNDLAKVFVEGEYSRISFDSDITKIAGSDVVAQAGVILTPAKGCTITGAVRGVFSGIGADKVGTTDYKDLFGTSIVIPLSFNFNL